MPAVQNNTGKQSGRSYLGRGALLDGRQARRMPLFGFIGLFGAEEAGGLQGGESEPCKQERHGAADHEHHEAVDTGKFAGGEDGDKSGKREEEEDETSGGDFEVLRFLTHQRDAASIVQRGILSNTSSAMRSGM